MPGRATLMPAWAEKAWRNPSENRQFRKAGRQYAVTGPSATYSFVDPGQTQVRLKSELKSDFKSESSQSRVRVESELPRLLFRPQGDEGIYPRGAPGGDQARRKRQDR